MNLDALIAVLNGNADAALQWLLPDGSFVPAHFHITEVGRVQKDFIDCGGTTRATVACVFQVWVADDIHHRLNTTQLARIIQIGRPLFQSMTIPVEVEYDNGVISQYPVRKAEVTSSGVLFHLGSKHTTCLAQDRCGIPVLDSNDCQSPGCC